MKKQLAMHFETFTSNHSNIATDAKIYIISNLKILVLN